MNDVKYKQYNIVHAARILYTRPRFLPVEETFLSTNSRHAGDQLSPSQHQTRFKCVICRGVGEGNDREREGIREMGFNVKPKEKKDSVNTAGCISDVLDFTDSIFLSLPLTHPPL